jgi:hypothetical protein
MNQHGEIQPVGGINEKIEGFFKFCVTKGLTGTQGVIIPIQNVPHLHLSDEVIEAMKNNQFHLYSIKTVDEALELLTGLQAGKLIKNFSYESGTANYFIDTTLKDFAEIMEGFPEDKKELESIPKRFQGLTAPPVTPHTPPHPLPPSVPAPPKTIHTSPVTQTPTTQSSSPIQRTTTMEDN